MPWKDVWPRINVKKWSYSMVVFCHRLLKHNRMITIRLKNWFQLNYTWWSIRAITLLHRWSRPPQVDWWTTRSCRPFNSFIFTACSFILPCLLFLPNILCHRDSQLKITRIILDRNTWWSCKIRKGKSSLQVCRDYRFSGAKNHFKMSVYIYIYIYSHQRTFQRSKMQ